MRKKSKVLLGMALVTAGILSILWFSFNQSLQDVVDNAFDDPENWGL
jgi:hypothetical protein